MSNRFKYLVAIGGFITFLTMTGIITYRVTTPLLTDGMLESMRTVCSSIPAPESARVVRNSTIIKSGLAVFSTYYETDMTPNELDEHMTKHMNLSNWIIYKEDRSSTTKIFFKQDIYITVLEYQKNEKNAPLQFSVACSLGVY